MTASSLWKRHQQHLCRVPAIGLTLDVSRMRFDDGFLQRMAPAMQRAFEAMDAVERGDIANPDEKRMVGHYWLRAPDLAPRAEIAAEIRKTIADVKKFAAGVHSGSIRPPTAARFTCVLSVGIGGSALGPMFVADALGNPTTDRMRLHFIARFAHGPERNGGGLAGSLPDVRLDRWSHQ
jgi:glucose-6-phosphate isomerase